MSHASSVIAEWTGNNGSDAISAMFSAIALTPTAYSVGEWSVPYSDLDSTKTTPYEISLCSLNGKNGNGISLEGKRLKSLLIVNGDSKGTLNLVGGYTAGMTLPTVRLAPGQSFHYEYASSRSVVGTSDRIVLARFQNQDPVFKRAIKAHFSILAIDAS